jgi:hypothetical protein
MAEAATRKTATKKSPAKKASAESRVPTGSRKSLDDMSDSHRAHVLKWEPHLENLKAEFVWIAVSRFPQKGAEGPHYVCIKRADKDFAIVDYDTANPKAITKRNVLDEGFTTASSMLDAFKAYRQMARDERAAASESTKPAPKKPAAKKAAATKKAPAKKAPAKRTPAAKRARKPAASKTS